MIGPNDRKYLAAGIDFSGLKSLVIGGGSIGSRKAEILSGAGSEVTVISPKISNDLKQLVDCGKITWRNTCYSDSYLKGFDIIVAATNDVELNLQISHESEKQNLLCCNVSSAQNSSFIFPATLYSDGFTISVHSDGKDCSGSLRLRDTLKKLFSQGNLYSDVRDQDHLSINMGKVYLVGAGPGIPDLLTMRGHCLLQKADLIICDNLLPRNFLDDLRIARQKKIVEWVGKESFLKNQVDVNNFMVNAAKKGMTVVRLKGGDPLVFGRGKEEVEFLQREGVPWELVPGLSSCTGALTSAGMPVTSRGQSRSFAVVTARKQGGSINKFYPKADSLIILMGVSALDKVADQLIHDGWRHDTPCCLVERATLPWERHAEGILSEIANKAEAAGICSPALFVVGKAALKNCAVSKRDRVLFTGLDPSRFRSLGSILHWPALKCLPSLRGYRKFPETIENIASCDFGCVIFTDKLAIEMFFSALADLHMDSRILADSQVVAFGHELVSYLQQHGIHADKVLIKTKKLDSQDIFAGQRNKPVLIVAGTHTPKTIVKTLRDHAIQFQKLVLARLIRHPGLGRHLPDHDVIFFVSPSAVRIYWNTYGKTAFQKKVICLGKTTLKRVQHLGMKGKIYNAPTLPYLRDHAKNYSHSEGKD